MTKTGGFSGSNLKIAVEVSAGAGGLSQIHRPDGTVVDGSPQQRFVKIEAERVIPGDWFVNLLTNESHKVLAILPTGVTMTTASDPVFVKWSDLPDAILLVVNY